jgi:hypothetical protein
MSRRISLNPSTANTYNSSLPIEVVEEPEPEVFDPLASKISEDPFPVENNTTPVKEEAPVEEEAEETPVEETVEEATEEVVEEDNYPSLTVPQLKALCIERELKSSGTKLELIERLRADDNSEEEATEEVPSSEETEATEESVTPEEEPVSEKDVVDRGTEEEP